jgi:TatA/E family protein of Tat protein translocase
MLNFLSIFGMPGWQELLIILVLALVLFGPRRLPEIAEAMGKSIRKFKSATKDATADVKRELDDAKQAMEDDDETEKKS